MATATTHIIYGYDRFGRLASVTSARLNGLDQPDPANVLRFDASGNAVAAEGPTTLYTYDNVGNLDTVTLPNGVVEDYDYDSLNRLDLLTVRNAGGYKLFEQDYVLQNDGKRDYVIEKRYDGQSVNPFSKVKIDWTYDALGRLTAETRDADPTPGDGQDDFGTRETAEHDYTDTFTYDLASNRMRKQRGWDADGNGKLEGSEVIDQTTAYAYNERDQLLSETTGGVTTTYQYNANGSTTLKSTGGQDTVYIWDLRNRLVAIDAPGTASDALYAYDHRGVRVAKGVDGVVTFYLIDRQNPTGYAKAIEEHDAQGLARSYVFGHDIIAQTDDGATSMFFLKDGHGSTRALLDGSGQVINGQTFDFDAFGEAVGFDPALAATEWLAPDGRRDVETGFTYSLARYRNGWRFISEDDPRYGSANDPVSLHKYLYVHANPIMGIDPSGNINVPQVLGGAAMAIGAVAEIAGMAIQAYGFAKLVVSTLELMSATLMYWLSSTPQQRLVAQAQMNRAFQGMVWGAGMMAAGVGVSLLGKMMQAWGATMVTIGGITSQPPAAPTPPAPAAPTRPAPAPPAPAAPTPPAPQPGFPFNTQNPIQVRQDPAPGRITAPDGGYGCWDGQEWRYN